MNQNEIEMMKKPLCEQCKENNTIAFHDYIDCPVYREEFKFQLALAERSLDRAWELNR